MPSTDVRPPTTARPTRPGLRAVAAGLAGAMAVLYLAIFAGILSVGRAEAGELGVLGVAGGVFAAIAIALWSVERRALWVAAALLQVPIFAMYVAIAPERDPSFEVWGITLRVLQLALVVVLALMVAATRRPDRPSGDGR
jgi:hypothetical protein